MNGALAVESLSGGYTHAPVLREISLHVDAGEMVALFGANGAGKTTLLRGLSGTLPVCRGEVWMDGRRIEKEPPWTRARSGLAHVPEGRHVFAPMTVLENLEVASAAARQPIPLSDIFELFPRLAERRDQRAGTLSGGEQQMLAIGRALVMRPSAMLVDEVSAGLAPVVAQRLVEALVDVCAQGVGILLVEQAPHLVADVVDRVYLLEQGRIVGEGSLAALGGAAAIAELYLGVA